MHGPALAVATVVVSTVVLLPLFLYAVATDTGPVAGALLLVALAALAALAVVAVRSLRDGRM